MSYEILYDTQFIRSKSGITPAILSGSNNCTEVNWTLSGRRYERGERGWWVLFNRVGVSEEDFMATLDEMVENAFNDQCTGANPRYPLMSEMKEMYLKAYHEG